MISIAMTTYNGEKYLEKQIDSILSQTYQDFELIICDDSSKDGTLEILKKYAKKDTRIKFYINKTNLGFLKNFEKCINLCTGDYIAFSDQDDIWLPEKLQFSLNKIKDNYLFCSNATLINEFDTTMNITMKDIIKIKEKDLNSKQFIEHFLYHNFVQGSTILAKATFIKQYLPIPDDFIYHDWYYGLLASLSNKLVYSEKTTLLYRQHPRQCTKAKKLSFKEKFIKEAGEEAIKINEQNMKRNILISNNNLYPISFREKAKKASRYFFKLNNKKDYQTHLYFVINYKKMTFDKNIIHKIFSIIKSLLGTFINNQ